ncbi:MAG: hypothetical protein Q9157_007503 [Trypethelium eluteriae]
MLNGDIETDFLVDEASKATLRIQHDGAANRAKITAQEISRTSFTARLTHVQYGTYNGDDAVLLRFNFEFRFENESIKRLKSASIRLTLEETRDSTLVDPSPRNPKNDPKIVVIAPVQVCGEVKEEVKSKYWLLRIPVQYSNFGLKAGPEGEFGVESEVNIDHRMWINGYTTSDDYHHEDNIVIWDIKENEAQESGILHRFPTMLVAVLPKEPKLPVKLTGLVQPSIAFSLNPLRLRSKRDDPIYLDTNTPKGEPFAPTLDFNSPDFPWQDVVNILPEYTVRQSLKHFEDVQVDMNSRTF